MRGSADSGKTTGIFDWVLRPRAESQAGAGCVDAAVTADPGESGQMTPLTVPSRVHRNETRGRETRATPAAGQQSRPEMPRGILRCAKKSDAVRARGSSRPPSAGALRATPACIKPRRIRAALTGREAVCVQPIARRRKIAGPGVERPTALSFRPLPSTAWLSPAFPAAGGRETPPR